MSQLYDVTALYLNYCLNQIYEIYANLVLYSGFRNGTHKK